MPGRTTYDYAGQAAIITGATKGIGRGIAEAFADAGADVAICARTESDVEEAAADLDARGPGDAIGVPADVSDPAEIEALVDAAVDAFGTVEALVNNAAMWPKEESMVDASLEDWNQTIAVNVRSQFYASQLVARHMIDHDIDGRIVNITSQTGDRRTGGRGLYGLSNTAVNGLTWRMAHDLAKRNIRMNAVSTDATDTYQLRLGAEPAADPPERTVDDVLDDWGDERPLGRLGEPSDLADAVLFLCSDRADYIVGTILRVSGGGNLQ
jgi:NAD(P)-dependent dehydrogenase (short-subunit alcohol dehydrogenase family)